MFVMFFNVVFSMFVRYSAAFCQLRFYNKDWIGLDWKCNKQTTVTEYLANFIINTVVVRMNLDCWNKSKKADSKNKEFCH